MVTPKAHIRNGEILDLQPDSVLDVGDAIKRLLLQRGGAEQQIRTMISDGPHTIVPLPDDDHTSAGESGIDSFAEAIRQHAIEREVTAYRLRNSADDLRAAGNLPEISVAEIDFENGRYTTIVGGRSYDVTQSVVPTLDHFLRAPVQTMRDLVLNDTALNRKSQFGAPLQQGLHDIRDDNGTPCMHSAIHKDWQPAASPLDDPALPVAQAYPIQLARLETIDFYNNRGRASEASAAALADLIDASRGTRYVMTGSMFANRFGVTTANEADLPFMEVWMPPNEYSDVATNSRRPFFKAVEEHAQPIAYKEGQPSIAHPGDVIQSDYEWEYITKFGILRVAQVGIADWYALQAQSQQVEIAGRTIPLISPDARGWEPASGRGLHLTD